MGRHAGGLSQKTRDQVALSRTHQVVNKTPHDWCIVELAAALTAAEQDTAALLEAVNTVRDDLLSSPVDIDNTMVMLKDALAKAEGRG